MRTMGHGLLRMCDQLSWSSTYYQQQELHIPRPFSLATTHLIRKVKGVSAAISKMVVLLQPCYPFWVQLLFLLLKPPQTDTFPAL